MAVAPARTSAGILGMALITAHPSRHHISRSANLTPAAIESTRRAPELSRLRQAASTSPGLTATTAPFAAGSRPSGAPSTSSPSNRLTRPPSDVSSACLAGDTSMTATSDGARPAGLEQPGDQGLTHFAAAHYQQFSHHGQR